MTTEKKKRGHNNQKILDTVHDGPGSVGSGNDFSKFSGNEVSILLVNW